MTLLAGAWPRDVLVVSGPDAMSFLQGQLSADVLTLDPGQSTLALLLQPSGKLHALLRLWRTDEHVVVIDTDAGAADVVEARLSRFLLRTEVAIEKVDWTCVAVRGAGSVAPGGAPAFDAQGSGAELVGLGLWPGVDGVDLLGRGVELPQGFAPCEPSALEALRIRSGWPRHGAEIAGEHSGDVIPAEVGPWLITAAVSFTKGCYVGQELTARVNARGGNVPRRLRSFELPAGATASPGDRIVVVGGEEAAAKGTVTSTAVDPSTSATVAMGYVQRSVPEDARLTVP
jgi:folate-binding protein YgfZ